MVKKIANDKVFPSCYKSALIVQFMRHIVPSPYRLSPSHWYSALEMTVPPTEPVNEPSRSRMRSCLLASQSMSTQSDGFIHWVVACSKSSLDIWSTESKCRPTTREISQCIILPRWLSFVRKGRENPNAKTPARSRNRDRIKPDWKRPVCTTSKRFGFYCGREIKNAFFILNVTQ